MKQLYLCFYRLIPVIGLFASLLFPCFIYSQGDDLSFKAEELIYSNPDEAIKIGEHILKTANGAEERAPVNLLISKSYLVKGDYNRAISYVFEEANQDPSLDLQTQVEANLLKSKLLRILYLDNQSKKYLLLAEDKIPDLSTKAIQDSLLCNVMLERINLNLNIRDNDKALSLINETDTKFGDFLDKHSQETEKLYIAKEKVLRNLSMHDSAFVYIDKLFALSSLESNNNLFEKATVYSELGYLYLQKKDFKKSEEMLFIALRFASILNNNFLLEEINRNLAINYLASNQKSKHKVYNDEFLILNSKNELMEQESINSVYNILNLQNTEHLTAEEKKYTYYIYFALGGILLIVFGGSTILIRNQWRKKRLKEILRYLEISRKNFVEKKPSKKGRTKKIVIPEDTENAILSKLKKFEKSQKFVNKDMSLAVLAGQFETNTKYLSEIINKHYHDHFNTFINKLRIDFIIDKLKTDPNYMNYKISFLAEDSGFSSHSSFATVFKSIVGMSPATFINLLKEEREELTKTNPN